MIRKWIFLSAGVTMAFEVNNDGVNRVNDIQQKKKYEKPETKQIQAEDRDFDVAYSVLGAASLAQFQASQKSQKSQEVKNTENTTQGFLKKYKSGKEFLDSLSKECTITDQEADEALLKKGFTKEEIIDLRAKFPLTAIFEALNLLLSADKEPFGDLSKEDVKEMMTSGTLEPEVFNLLVRMNKNNVSFLQKQFNIDENKSIKLLADIINQANDKPQDFDKYAPDAIEQCLLLDEDLSTILGCFNIAKPPSIEQLKARILLDNACDESCNYWAATFVNDPSLITPEFVSDYSEVYKVCKAHKIDPNMVKDPNTDMVDIRNMLEKMQQYGFDFSWYNSPIYKSIRRDDVIKILQTKKPENAKVFIDSCSEKCKQLFPNSIIQLAKSDIDDNQVKSLADFCNFVAESEEIANQNPSLVCNDELHSIVLGELKRFGIDNFADATKLLKTYKSIGVFPLLKLRDALRVKDNDFESAINFLNTLDASISKFYKDEDKQRSFKMTLLPVIFSTYDRENSAKFLQILSENDLLADFGEYPYRLLRFVNKANEETIERFKFYKKIGVDLKQCLEDHFLSEKYAVEPVKKLLSNYVSVLKEEYGLTDIDDKLLWAIGANQYNVLGLLTTLVDKSDMSTEEIQSTGFAKSLDEAINEKNKHIYQRWYKEKPENISISDIITIAKKWNHCYYGKEFTEFAEELMYDYDCKFPKEKIADLISPLLTIESVDFARELCYKHYPEISAEKICDVTKHVNYWNLPLARKICLDEKLKDKDIPCSILDNVTSGNLTLAERFCYEDSGLSEKDKNIVLSSCVSESNTKFAEELLYNKEINFPKQYIANVVHSINSVNYDFAKELCLNKNLNFPQEYIADILSKYTESRKDLARNLCFDDELNFPKEYIADILSACNSSDQRMLAEYLCMDKKLDFPKKYIADIVCKINGTNTKLAQVMCTNKELNFPKEHISHVLHHTFAENISVAQELCTNMELNFPKNKIAEILSMTNSNTIEFVKRMFLSNEFNIQVDCGIKILKHVSSSIKDKSKIESLLSSEKMKNWLVKNIEAGLPISTILVFYNTQAKLNREAEKLEIKAQKAEEKAICQAEKQNEVVVAKSEDIEKAERILVNLGVHPKMAPNYIKLCQENGIVDYIKLNAVCALAKANVPFKEFKNIFNIAVGNPLSDMNGQFRIDIIDDIAKLLDAGVNDVKLATNLSATVNMSDVELHSRLNPNIRTDMANRLDALDDNVKEKLVEAGFDIEAIKEKALKKPKTRNVNKDLTPKKPIKLRSFDSIVGVEKVVLNKFKNEIPQETWANPEAFKKWAEDKLESVLDFEQNPNYTAVGSYSGYNKARIEGVKNWYEYLTKESNYKDDVFVHLLVMDGITKEMRPNNAFTPPAVSHESFEATYNALLEENTNVSFSDLYARQTKIKAIKKYSKGVQVVDGIEGQWVTVPRSQKGEPDYDENVAMVQALAEGSSWCLRFENAHSYLQQGNLHFFLDKNGKAQVAINETDGVITQIQKRYNQDSTVPVAYSTVIEEWAKENNYTGREESRGYAKNAKLGFDKLRKSLAKLMSEKNYIEVFKVLGINVKVLDDGTYAIDRYIPKYKPEYTLFDLGLNENELMANVSEINSANVSLDGSSLTSLPKLRKVAGKLHFGDCAVGDLRSLELVDGKNVYWDK